MRTMNRRILDTNRKSTAMSALLVPVRAVSLAVRTLLVCVTLAVPVLAVPAMGGVEGGRIEAPALKKQGAGFVLLVSLQRG